MKILPFNEFAALPAGTIFSYYQPCICEGLYRKGKTLLDEDGEPSDFFEASVVAAWWNGEHPSVEDIEGRWGMYDYDQLFAVYEPEDVALMVRMLGGGATAATERAGKE